MILILVDLLPAKYNKKFESDNYKKQLKGIIMGKLVNYVTQLHQATSRDYIDRMVDEKVKCMQKAK